MRRLWLSLLVTGCFKPSYQDAAWKCGPGGECPAGQSCHPDGYCHSGAADKPDARPRPDAPYGTPDAAWMPDAPFGTPDAAWQPDSPFVLPLPDAAPQYTWQLADRNVTSQAGTVSSAPSGPCSSQGQEEWVTIDTAPGGTLWYFTSQSGIYYYTDPQALVEDCASGQQYTNLTQYAEVYSTNPTPPFWAGLEDTSGIGICDTGQIYIADFYFCE